jgi:hypothetical protein
MYAVLSHNVLVSNYVPFFELEDSSLEALDAIHCTEGHRRLFGDKANDACQFFWIATCPRTLLDMDDGTTHMTRVATTVTLCRYTGTPLSERYCEVFAELSTFDAWIKGLDATYCTSLRLTQVEDGSCYYRLHPDLVQRAEAEFDQSLATVNSWLDKEELRQSAGNVASEEEL